MHTVYTFPGFRRSIDSISIRFRELFKVRGRGKEGRQKVFRLCAVPGETKSLVIRRLPTCDDGDGDFFFIGRKKKKEGEKRGRRKSILCLFRGIIETVSRVKRFHWIIGKSDVKSFDKWFEKYKVRISLFSIRAWKKGVKIERKIKNFQRLVARRKIYLKSLLFYKIIYYLAVLGHTQNVGFLLFQIILFIIFAAVTNTISNSKICSKNNKNYYLKIKICYENLKKYYLKP